MLIHCASAEGVAGVVRTWKVRYDTNASSPTAAGTATSAGQLAAETTPVNHGPRVLNFTSMVREDKIQGGADAFLDTEQLVFLCVALTGSVTYCLMVPSLQGFQVDLLMCHDDWQLHDTESSLAICFRQSEHNTALFLICINPMRRAES